MTAPGPGRPQGGGLWLKGATNPGIRARWSQIAGASTCRSERYDRRCPVVRIVGSVRRSREKARARIVPTSLSYRTFSFPRSHPCLCAREACQGVPPYKYVLYRKLCVLVPPYNTTSMSNGDRAHQKVYVLEVGRMTKDVFCLVRARFAHSRRL